VERNSHPRIAGQAGGFERGAHHSLPSLDRFRLNQPEP
jgi:hypothetical protein